MLTKKDLHRLPVGFRQREAALGDHVMRDVEDALAGEMEISLGEVVDRRLAHELIAAVPSETAQLSEIAVGRGSVRAGPRQAPVNRVILHPAPQAELSDAAARYDEQVPGLGDRGKLVPRFPFTLFYSVDEARILVLAVAHHKRRPGYWRSRLTER